jgi:4-hydroxy-3-polyprenylbenzoate decarboxylase
MWQVMTEHYKGRTADPAHHVFRRTPSCTFVAGSGFDYAILPKGCDEIGIAGAIQRAVRLVKCRTIDAYTLADAE